MRTAIYLSLTTLTALLAAAPVRLDSARDPGSPEIARLDTCIQARFLDRTTFGMRRILPNMYHGIRIFRPENDTEQSVVDRLQQKGYQVALYLVGRNALAALSSRVGGAPRAGVQGPAFITPVHRGEFPEPESLLADGRRALLSFQKSEGYDIRKDGWTVAMRPVRASRQACVQCHTSGIASFGSAGGAAALRMGDPLGVALYVYRRTDGLE